MSERVDGLADILGDPFSNEIKPKYFLREVLDLWLVKGGWNPKV